MEMPVPRYRPVAIILHWAIAALLMFQLGLGWHMTSMPRSAVMFDAFQFHKSIGIAVLLLSLLRVAVRLALPRPAPVGGARWETLLASGVHGLLYFIMIGGPLTGWALVSTAPVAMATLLFHTVPLPHLPLVSGWHGGAQAGHWLLAWMGAGLICLHVAGALKHQLSMRSEEWVVPRMMPAHARSRWGGVSLALGGLLASFALPWVVYRAGPVEAAPVASAPLVQVPLDAETPAVLASDEPAKALSHDWGIEPGGRLSFSATVNGGPVEGRFGKWTGKVTYDPDHPKAAKLVATVVLASAASGDQTRDSMLQGPEFFGASPMGKAVFTAQGFTPAGGSRFTAQGKLAINGVNVPVMLDFDLKITDDKAVVKGKATLDRIALHVGTGQWSSTDQIGAEVGLQFNLKAHRR